MATNTILPVRHNTSTAGQAPECELVTYTGTPLNGDLLVKTDNVANVCGADPAGISWVALSGTSGVMPGNTTQFLVAKVRPTDIFEMNYNTGTASTSTIADADLDDITQYGIAKSTISSNTAWTVGQGGTNQVRVRIIGRLSPAADTYPRCLVQFIPSVCAHS